ncbi:LOW QUALITY PROTEIN: sperm-associated microtubule inner protein 4 [Sylvia borin]
MQMKVGHFRPLCLPFSPSHLYPTHISRYTMFPNVTSLEGRHWDQFSHQPFHPITSSKAFDMVVLRKTREFACSLSYEDFKPRHLDQRTIWENPVSLSAKLLLHIRHKESGTLLHSVWHETYLPAWRPEDGPKEITLPEWIPSCEVPQHQTALMELQHSFSNKDIYVIL